MRPDSIRLRAWHRYVLYAVLAVLFFTGAAWAWFNYLATPSGDFESATKSLLMKIHGAGAMVILVLLGTLLNGHVKYAWQAGRNRGNGILFLGTFGILIITGYGLYYAGGERLRAWSSWIHLAVGLALPILLLIHILRGRSTRPGMRAREQS